MTWGVIVGDCLEVMAGMADASVDAIVTDPPYGLGFMGKEWDSAAAMHLPPSAAALDTPLARFRTGKGPAAVAFDGHAFQAWTEAWAREALRVLKPGGNLLAAGGTRTYHRLVCAIEDAGFQIVDTVMHLHGQGFPKGKALLKPAWEPWTLARKKGKGWLGIDECRITTDGRPARVVAPLRDDIEYHPNSLAGRVDGTLGSSKAVGETTLGRWPANVILDEVTAAMLDEQSGRQKSGVAGKRGDVGIFNMGSYDEAWGGYGDTGGASRFFYVAKASRTERGEGNTHPTVKPLTLMRYLCRLACPAGGTILDPFAGSGTTGVAALLEGFEFIGIEREPSYVQIATQRLLSASGGDLPLFAGGGAL